MAPMSRRIVQGIVFVSGLVNVLAGLGLIVAPDWFVENIGKFPPVNRHFEGDIGAFIIPLGIGTMLAAREPVRNRLMVTVAAAASVLHALNHVYDAIIASAPAAEWLRDVGPLAAIALGMVGVWWMVRRGE